MDPAARPAAPSVVQLKPTRFPESTPTRLPCEVASIFEDPYVHMGGDEACGVRGEPRKFVKHARKMWLERVLVSKCPFSASFSALIFPK